MTTEQKLLFITILYLLVQVNMLWCHALKVKGWRWAIYMAIFSAIDVLAIWLVCTFL